MIIFHQFNVNEIKCKSNNAQFNQDKKELLRFVRQAIGHSCKINQ